MLKSTTIILVVNLLLASGCNNSSNENSGAVNSNAQDSIIPPVSAALQSDSSTRIYPTNDSSDFVNVLDLDPEIIVDMPYADTANFTHQQIYACAVCQLRPEVARGLATANAYAKSKGYCIKVFDCYRPRSAQEKMYAIAPDPTYVAHPSKGSKHGSGCAVDVTLCKTNVELDMGTAFDHFSEKSHVSYSGLTEKQKENRALLLDIMETAMFYPYENEWWHFNFRDCDYPQGDEHWECK